MHPGRSCPLSYSYRPEEVLAGTLLRSETLWIAGGLYGNRFALAELIGVFSDEPGDKALVFNGDFHWFDANAGDFAHVEETVLGFYAMRGNVETELAAPADGAGCGCAYPEWVDEGTVERSNRILEALRAAQSPASRARLAGLPMHVGARVGNASVAIVHGDLESLAGWDFSQEALATGAGAARAAGALSRAGADIVASSHTCLPVLQELGNGIIVNNGAAGMPNFRGERYGLATRISVRASPRALYRHRCAGVYVEAIPLRYDHAAWQRRFLELWPAGSDAHRSYAARIDLGPGYEPSRALRLRGAFFDTAAVGG